MQPVVLLATPTHGLYSASIVQSNTIINILFVPQYKTKQCEVRSFYILVRSDTISIVQSAYVAHLNLNLKTQNSNLATRNSRLEEKKASNNLHVEHNRPLLNIVEWCWNGL